MLFISCCSVVAYSAHAPLMAEDSFEGVGDMHFMLKTTDHLMKGDPPGELCDRQSATATMADLAAYRD